MTARDALRSGRARDIPGFVRHPASTLNFGLITRADGLDAP